MPAVRCRLSRRAPAGARALVSPALVLLMVLALGSTAAGPQAPRWHEPALQAAGQRLGPAGLRAAADLQQLLRHLQPGPAGAPDGEADLPRLQIVNDFFNRRIRFATDLQTWGVEDHWTTPLEVLARGQGDCEDYAIAKYAVLLAAGMPTSRLRLVYVRARLPPAHAGAAPLLQPHMVLAYHAEPGDEPLILDNLRPDILPAGQRPDLMPVFSFNSEGLWDAATAQPAGHPLVRLSRWRELVQRLRAEGWQP